MTRTGKIARLPRPVREQLNRRLRDNEPGKRLVAWLNGLPEVQGVLVAEFAGRAITEQNLSEWKQGGHREWLVQQDVLVQVREMVAQADVLRDTAGALTDHLGLVLASRYTAALAKWDGEPKSPIGQELRVLRLFCHDLVELRRGDHSAARLMLEQARHQAEQERTEEETLEYFQRWARNPEVLGVLRNSEITPEEKNRRIRSLFGLAPAHEPPTDGGAADSLQPSPAESN